METSAEIAAVAVKSECSVTSESSQEVKVEKIANGTVESTASSEKTVSQTISVSGDQLQQQQSSSVVEEVKHESSSSVVVDEKAESQPSEEIRERIEDEVVVENKSVEESPVEIVDDEAETQSTSQEITESSAQSESELPEEVAEIKEIAKVVNESQKQESGQEEEIEEDEILEPPAQSSSEIEKTEIVQESLKCTTPPTPPSQPTPPEISENSFPTDVVEEQSIEQETAAVKPQEELPVAPVEPVAQREPTPQIIEQPKPIEHVVQKEPTPVYVEQPKPEPVYVEQPNPAPVYVEQPKPAPVFAEQPRPASIYVEQPKLAPVFVEQPKPAPVYVQQPKPAPVYVEQPRPASIYVEQSMPVYEAPLSFPPAQMINDFKPPAVLTRTVDHSKEIEQESIKQQLNEIITDIEKNVQITNDDVDEKLSDAKKSIDFQKIFTPATDVDEIKPGANRKLFASSSFYSPTIHPTVEDQVELARRISHSLSDGHNLQSKGQSMYVNRKKRSVKWIHDDGHEEERFIEEHNETKENGHESSTHHYEHTQVPSSAINVEPPKCPLKLVMDPRHVQDFNSMRQYGYEPGPISPEFGMEISNALNAQHGRGAELFAKRRKKAEKWIVDGTKQQQNQIPMSAPPVSVPPFMAYSEVGTQHLQRNMQQDQIQEKYQQPKFKMVASPWETALQTGNVDNAFKNFDQQNQQMYSSSTGQVQSRDFASTTSSSSLYSSSKKETQFQSSKQLKDHLTGRDLAYRPSVPQGWNRPIGLQGIFTPPEIPVVSSTTSSITSNEKISKFSSTTSSTTNFQEIFSSESSNIKQESNAPAFLQQQPPAQLQMQPPAQLLNTQAKPYQSASQSFPPAKPQTPVQQQNKPWQSPKPQTPVQSFVPKPQTPVQKPQTPVQFAAKVIPPTASPILMPKPATPRFDNVSPRSGITASPSIRKMQNAVDFGVPIPPGGVIASAQSPIPGQGSNNNRLNGAKSPIPFINTAPAPYSSQFPAMSVQTPESIAQNPISTSLVPPLPDPINKPLPLIVNTPLPKFNTSYNNAARPFNEFKDYYRPIHMDSSKKLLPPLIYTDF